MKETENKMRKPRHATINGSIRANNTGILTIPFKITYRKTIKETHASSDLINTPFNPPGRFAVHRHCDSTRRSNRLMAKPSRPIHRDGRRSNSDYFLSYNQ